MIKYGLYPVTRTVRARRDRALMSTTEEAAPGRSAGEVLTGSRLVVDPELRAAVATLPDSMRHIAGYHFGWWDEHGAPIHGDSSKAVRPALVLLAAEAVGGDPPAALPGAVAVELVHNFSLLHDDVMDGDVTRRHRPTAWSVFGANSAILAGDTLLTLSFGVLAGSPGAIRLLDAAVQALLDGQAADLAFEQRTDVTLPEVESMALAKTGALLGCACALGAELGGAGPERVALLGGFGERLGLAFQLVDDLLGIWGDPEVTGKPVYSDLRNSKKTLPIVQALTSGTPEGDALRKLYLRAEPLADAELVRAAELVELSGGRAWAQDEADRLLGEALEQLAEADPKRRAAAELEAVARLVTHRDH